MVQRRHYDCLLWPFHLSGVEVVAQGDVWATPFGDTVASIGFPVEIVRGLTTFSCEHTPSNTYVFAWRDAAVGRDTDNLASAAIELFRNGDIATTTNGVVQVLPRELPFPHDGFGQDEDWVRANFTNAEEILSAGYPAWVDGQVGSRLENGLYKLVVGVPEVPPETVLLTVGDTSVAVTNAGSYPFLLGKGIRYELAASAPCASNFVYAAFDDVPSGRLGSANAPQLRGGGSWSEDKDRCELTVPCFPMVPGADEAHITWFPDLSVSPQKWSPTALDPEEDFTAIVTDIPWFAPAPTFSWESFGEAEISISGADRQTADMRCSFPRSYGKHMNMRLCATMGSLSLESNFSGTVEEFGVDDYEILNPGDTNFINAGISKIVVEAWPDLVLFEKQEVAGVHEAALACRYAVQTAGVFTLEFPSAGCSLRDSSGNSVSSGFSWGTESSMSGVRRFTIQSSGCSPSSEGAVFTLVFSPEDDEAQPLTNSASVVFVEWETRTVKTWPGDVHRKTIGVCEDVVLELNPGFPGSMPSSEAMGSVISNISDRVWNYQVSYIPGVDTISFPGIGPLCSFNVIPPTGYDAQLVQVKGDFHTPGLAGAFRAYFNLTLMPTNVSFEGIEIKESSGVSSDAAGYFAEPRNAHFLQHIASSDWIPVKDRNFVGSDIAQMAELPPPWGNGGSMTWPIPNKYRKIEFPPTLRTFCNTDQGFFVDVEGTATETKFGWFVTATTNRFFTRGRR